MRILTVAPRRIWLVGLLALACFTSADEERKSATFRVQLGVVGSSTEPTSRKLRDLSNIVIWLKPLDFSTTKAVAPAKHHPQVVQKNKTFEPHLLVVPAGSTVDFPNHDPFFHNVFSLFDGKRFDLGLYESGAVNSVHFDKPGISFLFCNIHPEMNAVIVAVDSPYFSVSDKTGGVSIPDIPQGRFELHVWDERSSAESLRHLTRTIEISSSSTKLETIAIPESQEPPMTHKDIYGQDYAPPADPYIPH